MEIAIDQRRMIAFGQTARTMQRPPDLSFSPKAASPIVPET